MEWISVKDELPKKSKEYIVIVNKSYLALLDDDVSDVPSIEMIVTTASYDSIQKIWHLSCGEYLNALTDIEDDSFNGDFVVKWMSLPE